MLIYFLFTV